MADYYQILSRALRELGARTEADRLDVYAQARDLLDKRLAATSPPPSPAEIRAQRAALANAIDTLEREIAAATGGESAATDEPDAAPARWSANRWPLRPWAIAAAVGVAAVVAAVTQFWPRNTVPIEPPKAVKTTAAGEDLAPGIDGGSSTADQPFYLRRQLVYYRTTYPEGSLIAHKWQNYLYLVLPNSTARRYSFALGSQCTEATGSRRISQKAEWPPWKPDQGARLASLADPMPGGPGNPLGARALDLDDGSTRIHGTNAPQTIGSLVARGCIRLTNDDVIDLYDRVPLGTRVVLTH
jgi:lipoprotein-anchoring transpeptidase ErfK/SrfK